MRGIADAVDHFDVGLVEVFVVGSGLGADGGGVDGGVGVRGAEVGGSAGDDGCGVGEEVLVTDEEYAVGAFFCLGDAFVDADAP